MRLFLSFAAAVVIHELSHVIAAKILGIRRVSLSPKFCGALLTFDFSGAGYAVEAVVHLAGSAGGIAAACISAFFFERSANCFVGISLVLSMINLLPISGLDGGAVLRALLLMNLMPDTAERIVGTVSFAAVIIIWTAAMWIELRAGGNLSFIILALSLMFSLMFRDR